MGNWEEASVHFSRFWINSIFGIFGLIDVASYGGIQNVDDRAFSDALGHYGVGHGPYFVMPGYGPLTTREVTDLVDSSYLPLSYLNIWGVLAKWVFEGMESRVELIPQEPMIEASPDDYSFMKGVYIQHLDYKAQLDTQKYDEFEEDYLDNYLDDY